MNIVLATPKKLYEFSIGFYIWDGELAAIAHGFSLIVVSLKEMKYTRRPPDAWLKN
jgi:hypothetical protein